MINVLVVDDTTELRRGLERATQASGRKIHSAGSAQDAINIIEHNNIDIVITDIKMESEQAGMDVLRAAKRKDENTQVIFVTAYATAQRGVQAMEEGAFDYIERTAAGINFRSMLKHKTALAIDYRKAKLREI